MTATDYSILDDLADDPGVINARKMAAIYTAIFDAALDNGGTVHASTVREHLPSYLRNEPRIGAAMSALARCGAIRPTGEYRPSGNAKSRNANRPTPVYEVRDLSEIAGRAA